MTDAAQPGGAAPGGLPPSQVRPTAPASGDRAPSPPPESAAPSSLHQQGDLIGGKYRLEAPLAKGGMASVWLAYNETLDVQVAVKFIRTDLAGPKDDRLAERLLQEARATARLGHPSIVRAQDFGQTDRGVPYLVMELLEGESLDVALERRGRIAARKAIRALLPVAHALAAAHDRGIIHRDLKPENIFLAQTPDGRVLPKLIDFGISRFQKRRGKRLTHIGEAVGTPAYMSPEQIYGEETDHRADIWAFCVLIYEAVTGRLPFHGINITATARSITRDPPTPISEFSAGDDQLWAILMKGLAKSAADRWSSMRELGSELACWLLDRGIKEDVSGASLEATWLVSASTSSQDLFASVPPPDEGAPRAPTPSPAAPAPAPPPGPMVDAGDAARQTTEPSATAMPRPAAATTASSPGELLPVQPAQPPTGATGQASGLSKVAWIAAITVLAGLLMIAGVVLGLWLAG